MIQKKISAIGGLLFIAGFFVYNLYKGEQSVEIRRTRKTAVGEIEIVGSDLICRFDLHGTEKSWRRSSPTSTLYDGECYVVYYSDSIPDRYVMAFDEPVIDISEFDHATTTTIQPD